MESTNMFYQQDKTLFLRFIPSALILARRRTSSRGWWWLWRRRRWGLIEIGRFNPRRLNLIISSIEPKEK